MTTCKECGATIIFVKTPAGKWMPCDEGLHPYVQDSLGKDFVVTDKGEVIRCRLSYTNRFPTGMARIPHWATCPHADKFRRRK